jgi:hypothetical protein
MCAAVCFLAVPQLPARHHFYCHFAVSANPEKIITVNIHKVNHNRTTDNDSCRHATARCGSFRAIAPRCIIKNFSTLCDRILLPPFFCGRAVEY